MNAHVSKEPVHLTCPEFLGALVLSGIHDIRMGWQPERVQRMLLLTPKGRKWHTAVKQYSFGQGTVFLHPIVIVMSGDYDGHTFARHC